MAYLTLDEIFAEADPSGLLALGTPRIRRTPEVERSRYVVEEANVFVDIHGRAPSRDADEVGEAVLATRLAKILTSPERDGLLDLDRHGLLIPPALGEVARESAPSPSWRDEMASGGPVLEEPASLDDIFADTTGMLDLNENLLGLRHVTPTVARQVADHRGERRRCRDFETFRPLFQDLEAAVARGERELLAFTKGGGTETLEGDFFVEKGLYAYIAEKSEKTVKAGRRDHRLRVVYSNGTESDVLMRSFERNMYDDPTAQRVTRRGFGPIDPRWDEDHAFVTGFVYVARSLSTQPEIARDRLILHKIGVTSTPVERRVADARNDPTFLLAAVEILAVYELHGMRRDKVEHILHSFFAEARADIQIQDRFGKTVQPREWFYVTVEAISRAVQAIGNGDILNFRYDISSQSVVEIR